MTVLNLLSIFSIVLQVNIVTVLCRHASHHPSTGNSSNHGNMTTSTKTVFTIVDIDIERSSASTAMAIVVIVLVLLLLITGCISVYYCFLEDYIKKKLRNGKRKGNSCSLRGSVNKSKSKTFSQKYQNTKLSKRMTTGGVASFVSKKRSNRSMKQSKRYLSQGTRKPAPNLTKDPLQVSISHNSLSKSAQKEANISDPFVKMVKSPELQLRRIPTKRVCTQEKKTKLQITIENACKNVIVKKKDSNHDMEASKKKSRKASKRRSTRRGKTSKQTPKPNINPNSKLW